jgi:hypothetical protein
MVSKRSHHRDHLRIKPNSSSLYHEDRLTVRHPSPARIENVTEAATPTHTVLENAPFTFQPPTGESMGIVLPSSGDFVAAMIPTRLSRRQRDEIDAWVEENAVMDFGVGFFSALGVWLLLRALLWRAPGEGGSFYAMIGLGNASLGVAWLIW